jgi:hypothetical protein
LSVLAPAADDAGGPAPGAAAAVPAPPPLLPAKRREEVDPNAHLLPPSKRRKESEEKQNRGRWSEFDVDEKKGEEKKGEEKKSEIAPETVESELTRWFAQNPPDEWYIAALIFLCYDVSSFHIVWVFVLQGGYGMGAWTILAREQNIISKNWTARTSLSLHSPFLCRFRTSLVGNEALSHRWIFTHGCRNSHPTHVPQPASEGVPATRAKLNPADADDEDLDKRDAEIDEHSDE